MIYCPRCDKPIAPDHRCLSRRHFFGLLTGAAAVVILAPEPVIVPASTVDVLVAQLEVIRPELRKWFMCPIRRLPGGGFTHLDGRPV